MFRIRRRRRSRRHSWTLPAPIVHNPNSRLWRVQEIQRLCNTNDYFFSIFQDSSSPYIISISRLSEVFNYTDDSIRITDAFKHAFGERLRDLFAVETSTKFKHLYGYTRNHGSDLPDFINQSQTYLLDTYKNGLLNSFLTNYKNFNPGGKKAMANLAAEFVGVGDSKTIDILRVFLRNIDVDHITVLLGKIPNGIDNPDVKKIISHTKTLEYLTFSEQAFNNDIKERERIVKAVGKTPSLAKRLPFKMTLTLEDLKFIAPAMRFDFVQYALQYEMRYARWGYSGSNLKSRVDYHKVRKHMQNLIMPMLTAEQMKELLFSVCLKKNSEFSSWMEIYSKYATVMSPPAPLAVMAGQ